MTHTLGNSLGGQLYEISWDEWSSFCKFEEQNRILECAQSANNNERFVFLYMCRGLVVLFICCGFGSGSILRCGFNGHWWLYKAGYVDSIVIGMHKLKVSEVMRLPMNDLRTATIALLMSFRGSETKTEMSFFFSRIRYIYSRLNVLICAG